MNPSGIKCVAIMGATATGKSELGIKLAERFDGEVISMDSRQVYRGLDIGTGKVTPQERARVPHHLIDTLDPADTNSAGLHARAAGEVVRAVDARGRLSFLVGGTGLYFRVLFEGLIAVDADTDQLSAVRAGFEDRNTEELYAELERHDAERARALSSNDRVRIARALEVFMVTGVPYSRHVQNQDETSEYDPLKIVLTMPRDQLRERIAGRIRAMFGAGWGSEVDGLLRVGLGADAPGMNSLGYQEIAQALASGQEAGCCAERVVTLTQQYAKRQETFFRGERGALWLDVTEPGLSERAIAAVEAHVRPE